MLLFPAIVYTRTYEFKFPAKNKSSITLKKVEVAESKPPETKPTASLYQGIQISREALSSYLEASFTKYGMEDRIPEAKKTIDGESSWVWYARNKLSAGIVAYTPSTWEAYCKQYGKYEDLNPLMQLACFSKMWSMGLDYHWDAYCLHYWDEDCIKYRNLHP